MSEPGAVITLREIYDLLLTMQRDLDPLPKQVEKHTEEIGQLKAWMWRASGGATVVGVIAGALLTLLFQKVGG